ncbi:MAG: fumarylacetoacetate hydrolase family protein [Lentimicrobiaceae bacterium]|nr:fumarylacetoacetate hydrolase family protein [Lentimicrobiaceae bacterium]
MKIACVLNGFSNNFFNTKQNANKPTFYLIPDTTLLKNNKPFFYPYFTENLACCCGIMIKINKVSKHIPIEFANSYIESYCLAVQFIATDLLAHSINNNLPYTNALCFDNALALTNFVAVENIDTLNNVTFSMKNNSENVVSNSIKNLNFDFAQIISSLSKIMTVKTGDLIFVGDYDSTAENIKIGDKITASTSDDVLSLETRIR